jgi:hypothetical protein
VKLMSEGLGYERFGAQGGDWGALVSAHLGHAPASRMIGIHLTLMVPLAMQMPEPSDYSAEERGWLEQTQRFWREESGYRDALLDHRELWILGALLLTQVD